MAITVLTPTPVFKAFDNNGAPLAGGKLFTYQAGTTTKLATYTDSTGVTPNANPVILNSRGEANVWLPPNTAYKYVLAPSTDTDPPTNPIWTIDQINNSVLITLYGGVDTGVANAYVINFTANFSSYTDGIVIVWIPSNTNTTASTINVNGLGVINITNGDGTAIIAGALTANVPAQILIKGGKAILLNPYSQTASGTFNVTWGGFSVNPSTTVSYTRSGNMVTLTFPSSTGTSNANAFTFTGLPASLTPASVPNPAIPVVGLVDNSVGIAGGMLRLNVAGVSYFFKDGTAGSWTNAGLKGFGFNTTAVYSL